VDAALHLQPLRGVLVDLARRRQAGDRGILTEPYTDFPAIARRHPDCFLAGEGDTRILLRNDPEEIRAMVDRMLETSRMTGGYMMRIGNEFTWNTPVEAVKLYLDLCREKAHR
jgi:uroporphyrinogen-III decarboxylase